MDDTDDVVTRSTPDAAVLRGKGWCRCEVFVGGHIMSCPLDAKCVVKKVF